MAGVVALPDFNIFNALGLSPSQKLTHSIVEKAYRKASLHVHPDKKPPKGHFPKFNQLQQAFDFLGGDQGLLSERLNRAREEQVSTYKKTFYPELPYGHAKVFRTSGSLSLILSLDFGSSMSSVQAATADGNTIFDVSHYPRARSSAFGRGADVKEVPTRAYYRPNARTPGLEFGYPPGNRTDWDALEHLKSLIDPQQERSPPAITLQEKLQGIYEVDDILIGMLAFLYNHTTNQLRTVCGRYDIVGFVAAIPCTYGKSAQQRYEHLLGRAGWPVDVLQWVWEPEAIGYSALADAPVLGNLSREKSGVAVLVIDLGGLTCDAIGHAIDPCGPRADMHLTREIARPVGHFGGSGMARYVFEGWIAQRYPDLRQHIDRLFDDFWDRAMALEKAEHMDLTHQVDIPLEQVQGILDAVFDGVFTFFEKQLTPILRHQTWDTVVLYGGTSQSEFVKARLRPLLDQYEPLTLIDNLPEQATVVSRGALKCFLAASRRIENLAYELAAVSLGIRMPGGTGTRSVHPLKTQGMEFQDIDQKIVPFSLHIEHDALASFTHNLAATSFSLAFCYCEQAKRNRSGRNLYPDYVDMDEIRLSISEAAARSIEQHQLELSRNHTCVAFGVSCHPRLTTTVDLVVWYKLPPRMKGSWQEISRQAYRFTIDPGSGRILLEGV